MKSKSLSVALIALGLLVIPTQAASLTDSLKAGKPDLQSIGPISFGPEGILFAADTKGAALFAIATDDNTARAGQAVKVEAMTQKIGALLGVPAADVLVNDMAVHPISHNTYLAVSRGRGTDAQPALLRVKADGQLETVSLENVKFSKAVLPNAPASTAAARNPRLESITDIAFLDGQVIVAGLSNEEFASKLRSVPFPFQTVANGTSVEIYHGSHGQFETRAPIRTFVSYKIGTEQNVLAAYTCTPLVKFPLSDLKPGAKVQGKTIGEFGNGNQPLDMIVYQKGGKDYLLMANSRRGVMKITTDNIDKEEPIVAPVANTKGLGFETIAAWTGVEQLDRLSDQLAMVVRRTGDALSLESLPLP